MIFINTGAWFAAVVPTDPASTFSFQLSAFSFDPSYTKPHLTTHNSLLATISVSVF